MIRASITPGMARTRLSRSSESMVAPPLYVVGQSAEVPRYVPVCVYRTFHVGRREPLAPVRTKTSLPSVWTPKTSCPPATASRPENRETCPVGRRRWISCRSSSQKAVIIRSIATASFFAQKKDVSHAVAVTDSPWEGDPRPRQTLATGYTATALLRPLGYVLT